MKYKNLQGNEELGILLEKVSKRTGMDTGDLWILAEAIYQKLEFIETNRLRDELETEINKLVTEANKRLLQIETKLHEHEVRGAPDAIIEKAIYATGLTSQEKRVTLH